MLRRIYEGIRDAWISVILISVFAAAPCEAATYNLSYDESGRLVGVVDSTGNTAIYGYDATGNILSISRSTGAISIASFSPGSGPVGATVTISGYGFSGTTNQNTVTFNGTAAQVTAATTTQLSAVVPAGATTGPIFVTSPNGSATSSGSFSVTVSAAPTIASISPTIGTPGTAFTIGGSNYQLAPSENSVALNGRPTTVRTATATTLGAVVPTSSTSGRLVVATPYGQTTSSQDFFVPPSPHTPADVSFTGRMAIGGSQTVSFTAANKIALVLFDGTAGQKIGLLTTSSSIGTCLNGSLLILGPNGSVVGNTASMCNGEFIGAVTLPATGTYTIVMTPAANSTGTITCSLSSVPADATATASTDGTPTTVNITTLGQNAAITFNGTAGQRISINLGQTGSLASGYCNSVPVVKPDGTNLFSNTSACRTGWFSDVGVLPATGTYTIKLITVRGQTGSATFSVYTVPADVAVTIPADGTQTSVNITTPGQNANLSFSGTAGQRISVNLSQTGTLTSNCNNLPILNPDGTNLTTTGECGSGYYTDVITLPTTGTYTIAYNPGGTGTGTATFNVYTTPSDATATLTTDGTPTSVNITTPGQNASLTFSGTVGQRISIYLSQSGTLTNNCNGLPIVNPDGTNLTTNGECGTTYFSDLLTLPQTGTYTIKYNPGGTGTGTATFTVYTVPPDATAIAPTDGTATNVTTTVPGQNAAVTFSGAAAQRISVYLSQTGTLTNNCNALPIVNPDGTNLTNTGECGPKYFTDVLVLPATGTYTIKYNPGGMGTGTATFNVYAVPPDVTATLATDGTATSVTTTVPGQNAVLTFNGLANQSASFSLTQNGSLTSNCNGIVIVKPDGTNLVSTSGCGASWSGSYTLPSSGGYTVKFDPYDIHTGTATFSLTTH